MNRTATAITDEKQNPMGTMPVGRLLFTMALPMMISMLVQALYNIFDSLVVASFSEDGVTALSLAFPIQSLMIAFATGTGVGINSCLSRSLGEGRRDRASRAATNGLFVILLTNIAFMLLGLTATDLYFRYLTDATPGSAAYNFGVDYISVVSLFSTGLFFQVTFERLLQSTGKARLSMCSQGIGAIINIILDPIFILNKGDVLFGFSMPFGLGMGTKGAAIATVIGQSVAAIIGLVLNLTKNKEISLSLKGFRPEGKMISRIYAVGLPSVFMAAVGSFLTVALNKILTIGETQTYINAGIEKAKASLLASERLAGVAIYGVYFRLQSFVFMPIFGMNNGMIPIVAYNYGMRSRKRILKTVKLALIAAVIYMIIGLSIFQLFSGSLIKAFYKEEGVTEAISEILPFEEGQISEGESLTEEAEHILQMSKGETVLYYGEQCMRIISLCFLFAGVCIITISTLQAVGKGGSSLIISLIRQIVIILPLTYILANSFGLIPSFWAFPIAELAAMSISIILFVYTYNKQIKPLDIPLPPSEGTAATDRTNATAG